MQTSSRIESFVNWASSMSKSARSNQRRTHYCIFLHHAQAFVSYTYSTKWPSRHQGKCSCRTHPRISRQYQEPRDYSSASSNSSSVANSPVFNSCPIRPAAASQVNIWAALSYRADGFRDRWMPSWAYQTVNPPIPLPP